MGARLDKRSGIYPQIKRFVDILSKGLIDDLQLDDSNFRRAKHDRSAQILFSLLLRVEWKNRFVFDSIGIQIMISTLNSQIDNSLTFAST